MKKFWSMLSTAGKIIFSIIILAIIALIVVLIAKHNKNNKDEPNSNTPEVAQTYEPSIGTPLPADVKPEGSGARISALVENSGEVAGATTTEPSTSASSPEQAQQMMIAPKTGIDPNEPVVYENSDLKFKANLPAGTQVKEFENTIKFFSKTGSLYYVVSVSNSGSENLQSVANQLKNSSTASNVNFGTLSNTKTSVLNFSASEYGQGQVIIANNKIYYLLGNSKFFSTFNF